MISSTIKHKLNCNPNPTMLSSSFSSCSPFPLKPISSILVSILLLLSSCPNIHGGKEPEFLVLSIKNLMTSGSCSTPKGLQIVNGSLVVAHPYGPCSPLGTNLTVDPLEVLLQDQNKVNRLHERLSSPNRVQTGNSVFSESKPTVPVRPGNTLNSGNFVMTVGLGTPVRSQTVEIDTGSNTCWVQCKPCSETCYSQLEPLFDPNRSSSYRKVPCSSSTCSLPEYYDCDGAGSCLYGVLYGDQSSSIGYLSQEKLTLKSTVVVPNFVFGCGESNQGLFGKAAGLFGLGRDPLSLIRQTSAKFGNLFSYCLPSTSRSTGYFRFGNDVARTTRITYTPMLTDSRSTTFYGISLTGISVAGKPLSISPTIFSKAGMIVDSGTVITRLPPTAYSALRTAFRAVMAGNGYRPPQAVSILDTCYDVTGKTNLVIPTVSLSFGGGPTLRFDSYNIVYVVDKSIICLAFAGNTVATDIGIIGNVQQKGFEIVHDLGLKRIGFAVGNC